MDHKWSHKVHNFVRFFAENIEVLSMNRNLAGQVDKRLMEDSTDYNREVNSMNLCNCHSFQHFQTVHCPNSHMTACRTAADRCNRKLDFD